MIYLSRKVFDYTLSDFVVILSTVAISEECVGLNQNLIFKGSRARYRSITFTQDRGFSGLL